MQRQGGYGQGGRGCLERRSDARRRALQSTKWRSRARSDANAAAGAASSAKMPTQGREGGVGRVSALRGIIH